MNPDRHAPPPERSPQTPSGGVQGDPGSTPGTEQARPAASSQHDTPTTSSTTPASDGDNTESQEAQRRQAEEAERRAREETERREREEAEHARTAELERAAAERHETLQTWLTSSGRLARPLSDRYLFWQVVNLLGDQTAYTAGVCDLLGVQVGDAGALATLIDHAKQGPEQLRRTALALMLTWAEDRLRTEQDWVDPFIWEHYRLLDNLGYHPTEVETQELAVAHAADLPGTPSAGDAEHHDS